MRGFTEKENDMRKSTVLFLLFAISLPCLARSASEQERNKAIARSFFEEALSRGQLEKYGEFHSKDFVAHAGDLTRTFEEDLADAREERTALADLSFRDKRMVREKQPV